MATDLEAMEREFRRQLRHNIIGLAVTEQQLDIIANYFRGPLNEAFDAGAEAMQKRCDQIARQHHATRTRYAIRALDPSALRDGDK